MLPPLTFRPLFKSMLWGGSRLPQVVGEPAPHSDPIGEAWVLSDVDGSESVVATGPLAGRTLRQVAADHPRELFGDRPPADGRFPLLLKFIDARQELSVQVHPCDDKAKRLAGPDKRGKTEAWVVLDRQPTSRIYAGFREGVTAGDFRQAVAAGTAADCLHAFTPEPGDCVFLPAGTVHAIGADLLVFEVQQTSDITYRLHDWGRVDAKTGKPRDLHIDHGLLCSDFAAGPRHPIKMSCFTSEGLVECDHFQLSRHRTFDRPLQVGAFGQCRAVVCVSGGGELAWAGGRTPVRAGRVVLLPASVGEAAFEPAGPSTLLECGF